MVVVGRLPLSDEDVVEGRDGCCIIDDWDGNMLEVLGSKIDLHAMQRVLGVRG